MRIQGEMVLFPQKKEALRSERVKLNLSFYYNVFNFNIIINKIINFIFLLNTKTIHEIY